MKKIIQTSSIVITIFLFLVVYIVGIVKFLSGPPDITGLVYIVAVCSTLVTGAVLIFKVVLFLYFTKLFKLRQLLKNTPRIIWKISFTAAIIGIIGIEYYEHRLHPGYGFLAGTSGAPLRIIEPDSVIDCGTFIADRFGATRCNIHTLYPNHRMGNLNTNGFISKYEFKQSVLDSLQGKKYFFVGDSYTQGCGVPVDSCFAGRIDQMNGRHVFNAGLGGTDPAQYVAVVQEYIGGGIIKPDEVDIFFCGANDFEDVFRKVTPDVPVFYDTNGGFIFSTIDSVCYSNAKDAYRHIVANVQAVQWFGNNVMIRTCDHSVILSELVNRFIGVIEDFAPPEPEGVQAVVNMIRSGIISERPRDSDDLPTQSVTHAIMEIKKICRVSGIPVRFFLIPGVQMVGGQKMPMIPDLENLDPGRLSLLDYPIELGDHPNSEGHRKICLQIIEKFCKTETAKNE